MAYSQELYRPSVLELARAGNFQAIGFWINSLLASQGISVHAVPTQSKQLHLVVKFHQRRPKAFYLKAQTRLVKFICYRLWTLNSAAIHDVQIVARVAGRSGIVWRQSVRIASPAAKAQNCRLRRPKPKGLALLWFLILRSSLMSKLAFAGFLLCYWLLHWQLSSKQVASSDLANAGALSPTSLATGVTPNAAPPIPSPSPTPTGFFAPPIFTGQEITHIESVGTQKVIALTFDDGPWPDGTEKILEILKQRKMKATFYWVGQQVQKHPELAKKVVAEGHAIGNHTWRHPMNNLDASTAAQEIGNTAKLIFETTGLKTNLFRPPGGNLAGELVPYAKKLDYAVTMWSVDSDDYYVSAPLIVDNVLKNAKSGAMVLLHDGGGDRRATIEALPQIIDALQRQGYRFVTVPELLEIQANAQIVPRSANAAPNAVPKIDPSAASSATSSATQPPSSPAPIPSPGASPSLPVTLPVDPAKPTPAPPNPKPVPQR